MRKTQINKLIYGKSSNQPRNILLAIVASILFLFSVVAEADGFGVSSDTGTNDGNNTKISTLLQSVQAASQAQSAQAQPDPAMTAPQPQPSNLPSMQPSPSGLQMNPQMNPQMGPQNPPMNSPTSPQVNPQMMTGNSAPAPTTNMQLPPPGQMPTNLQPQQQTQANPQDNYAVDDQAFAGAMRNMMPLSTDQIKTLHYLFDKSQQAVAAAPGVPPKPTSTSLIVNLSPGATPPVVRLSQGFVTSLVFVDATGAAWPIQAYDLGDNKSFNIQWDQKSNTLMVQALDRYKMGNLAIMLKGLDTPVMITLMPGQNAVDYRVDLRIPKLGPNANPVLENLPGSESPNLLDVLDGVPPHGSRALIIKGGDECQGWMLGTNIFLRTTMTILSPAFISTMSSPDGTHAYEIQSTPVILALAHGKIVKLTVEGL